MSNGRPPGAARDAGHRGGISWMEAVLQTTSMHISSEATPPAVRFMAFAARMPMGVAAFPSPNRFADTLAESGVMTVSSLRKPGKRSPSTGRSRRESPAAIPARRIISIRPAQRQRAPAMYRQRLTAAAAPSREAEATASPRPVAAEQMTAAATMMTQMTDIAI
jgi:hypothetical protein